MPIAVISKIGSARGIERTITATAIPGPIGRITGAAVGTRSHEMVAGTPAPRPSNAKRTIGEQSAASRLEVRCRRCVIHAASSSPGTGLSFVRIQRQAAIERQGEGGSHCQQLAESSKTESEKAAWLQLANSWIRLMRWKDIARLPRKHSSSTIWIRPTAKAILAVHTRAWFSRVDHGYCLRVNSRPSRAVSKSQCACPKSGGLRPKRWSIPSDHLRGSRLLRCQFGYQILPGIYALGGIIAV